ncbi:MAG: [FeFe] hydrogenase H-cluster maturation GTPase HydF [Lachnospiraceae bacterium]|nr:[FeFe] hydrogenase H-cluster maturation GTPase HydF [Lachnospiraceae bacterium]
MSTLNETPSSNRLHIGIFGKTNSGKSSLINAFTGQQVSIVSEIEGTTTDPVYKAMEIKPLGPCVIIDTAGFGDTTALGRVRMEKTQLALEKSDIAVLVLSAGDADGEELAADFLKKAGKPVLIVVNKTDAAPEASVQLVRSLTEQRESYQGALEIAAVSAVTGEGIPVIRSALTRLLPEDFGTQFITGSLVKEEDLVLLVMPQDIQAPKGRLILPQVQTIRELLDRRCHVLCVTTDQMLAALDRLKAPPKLIITDSQVFDYVYEHKPEESSLTSFSVLFAAYKGDLAYYAESAKAIGSLTEESKVLIAECCTHAPLAEDIGRVKIPRMLRKRVGEGLTIDLVSGTDFPEDPSGYDLIIQCGACMFNRTYVLSRIEKAKRAQVPMTNYGVTIAYVTGILDKIVHG